MPEAQEHKQWLGSVPIVPPRIKTSRLRKGDQIQYKGEWVSVWGLEEPDEDTGGRWTILLVGGATLLAPEMVWEFRRIVCVLRVFNNGDTERVE